MIINFHADPDRASLYDLFDATTGEPITRRPIFYADDEAGIWREYLKDDAGNFYLLDGTRTGLAWQETRPGNGFVIRLKSQYASEEQALRELREMQERFRREIEAERRSGKYWGTMKKLR